MAKHNFKGKLFSSQIQLEFNISLHELETSMIILIRNKLKH